MVEIRHIASELTKDNTKKNFENINYSLRTIAKKIKDINKISESSRDNSSVPIGTIHSYIGASAPANYLLCNGQEVSQSAYSALFQLIGTTYNTGGETAGFFRVPDLAGRFLRSVGGNASALGGFQNDAFKSHTHSVPAHDHFIASSANITESSITSSNYATRQYIDGGTVDNHYVLQGTSSESNVGKTSTKDATDASSTGIAEETRPTNMAVNFILRAL